MEKRERKREKAFDITLTVVFAVAILLYLWVHFEAKLPDMRFDSESVVQLEDGWTAVLENGAELELSAGETSVPAKAGETVTFRLVMPESNPVKGTYIMFYSGHQYVRVYLDGQETYSYGYGQKTPYPMSPGSAWQVVRLPADRNGKLLEIELTAYYDSTAGILFDVFFGTKSALVFMVLEKALFSLVVYLSILVVGVLLLCMSFGYRNRNVKNRIRYLGIFAIITSTWILLESQVSQFFTGNPLSAANLLYVLFGILPVITARLLLTYQDLQKNRFMNAMFYVCAVAFPVLYAAQATGLTSVMGMIAVCQGLLVLLIADVHVVYIGKWFRKEKWKESAIFYACVAVSFFVAADIAKFFLFPWKSSITFSRMGVLAFVGILGVSSLRQAAALQEKVLKQQTLERLAYMDIMTELQNRAAYEEELERCDKQKGVNRRILVLDVNGLKYINDHFGHKKGDQAICLVADCLKNVFTDQAKYFRIGGDEFCVISYQYSRIQLLERMEHLETELAKVASRVTFPLTVAWGMAEVEGEKAEKAFILADERMYEKKQWMKEKLNK